VAAVSTPDVDVFNAFEAEAWAREGKARLYHSLVGEVTRRVVEPVLDAASVAAGTRLVDVATGPGYLAAAAARRGASVVGIDISPDMLALAGRLHPGLEFRPGDAESLPFPDAAFDAVVAGFLLHHVGRPDRALDEFARVLRPGGRIAVTTWGLPEQAPLIGLLGQAVRLAGAKPPPFLAVGPSREDLGTDEELKRLLAAGGFTDTVLSTISFSHEVGSVDKLWEGCVGGSVRTAEVIRRQSEIDKRRIRDAFERLAERYRADGGLEVPVSVRLAAATKP
jgi:SAM-dependent methyltransferase